MKKMILSLCLVIALSQIFYSPVIGQTQSKSVKGLSPKVSFGIEVLITEQINLIRGKRVGLITNPSAVTSDMRSDVDVLASLPDVKLVALFAGEHGIRGALQGRIFQEGELDPYTKIPMYSLYGDSFAPKEQWLKGLDVLIFDIQGVGSAWYTFKYTMSYAMEAAAKAGVPFIVLDRPNPLGGEVVEGPLLDLGSIFRHPLPLRHGMTYGELATMWNEIYNIHANLTVVKMKGWRRDMLWNDTGLLWVMPSPNMPTFETVVIYPGQCLFERMNISEARGTTKPFIMTGAPWINGIQAAADLNNRNIQGAIFRPVFFIPQSAQPSRPQTPDRPWQKPWNIMCNGVEIMLTDARAYRSVEAAITIIDAYRKTNPDSLKWRPPKPLELLNDRTKTVEDIVKSYQPEVEKFVKMREKYLLY